jgi:O-antigen/teichoic acid export membrane protein
MGLFYFFRLLSEPLVALFVVMGKERRMFSFYAWNTVINVLAVVAGVVVFGTTGAVVLLFAGVNTLLYLHLSARLLAVTGAPWMRPTLRALAIVTLAGLFFAFVRYLVLGSLFPTL